MRWVKIWHIVFYVSLILPTYLAISAGTMRYSIWLILGLSLFLGVWYALIMMWLVPKAQGKRQTILSLVFIVVAMAVWFPLSRASWAYYLTAFILIRFDVGNPAIWIGCDGNIILTGLIIWSQALNLGKPVTFSIELLFIGIMVIGWAALLALWMRSVMRESAERKRLIEQLEETQRVLAAAERQSGILQERQRLAQEIHDTLAQGFTSIIMQLEAADLALPEEQSAVRTRLLHARETARLSLQKLAGLCRLYALSRSRAPACQMQCAG